MKPQVNKSSVKVSATVNIAKAIPSTPKTHIKKLNASATQSDPGDRNGGCIPQGV